jgi:hypothetical protein
LLIERMSGAGTANNYLPHRASHPPHFYWSEMLAASGVK